MYKEVLYRIGMKKKGLDDVLIVGGGPAGLSAAIELGSKGIKTIVVDDKQELGGKLTLQTHNFFGSKNESMAGMEIKDILRPVFDNGDIDILFEPSEEPIVYIDEYDLVIIAPDIFSTHLLNFSEETLS